MILSFLLPISNLTFIYTILEKVGAKKVGYYCFRLAQLPRSLSIWFLEPNLLKPLFLDSLNDMMMQRYAGGCSFLSLLDLTSAFDIVNHSVLLDRLLTLGWNIMICFDVRNLPLLSFFVVCLKALFLSLCC